MRVLLTAIGSRGDVQPLVVLGAALRAAGHDAVLAAPGEFGALAERAGIPQRPLGGPLRPLVEGKLRPRSWLGYGLLMSQVVEETLEATLEAAADVDAVVASGFQLAAASAAERLGLPLTVVALAPTSIRSAWYPPLPIAHLPSRRWLNPLAWRLAEWTVRAALGPALNAARARWGLRPVRNVLAHLVYGQRTLVAASAHVCPSAPDWPTGCQQVGYWLEEPAPPPGPADPPGPASPPGRAGRAAAIAPTGRRGEALVRFLDAGAPPVYLGFGSMRGPDPLRRLRLVLEAARLAGLRLVLGGEWGGLGGEGARPDPVAILAGDVPHAWLFPRVAAVVHHGGAGTTAAGLRAGRPSLLVPHLGDQLFWARRVRELGAGPVPLPLRALSPERLARALRELVEEPGYAQRAAALGRAIAAEGGLEAGVAAVAGSW